MAESVLRFPDVVMIGESMAECTAPGQYACRGICVVTTCTENVLRVAVRADEERVSYIRLRWNAGERIRGQVLGDTWERSYGDLGWRNLEPYRSHPWYVLLSSEKETVGYGVKVRPGAICSWQLDPQGVTLRLDVRSGGTGVRLCGRELQAADVVMGTWYGESDFDAACAFCRMMCTDPLLPERPVYGSNNWYYAYGRSSAEDILAEADYLRKLTEGLENRPYLVIDDGWQCGRYDEKGNYENFYNGGPWESNEKFGDMAALAAGIRSRNVIPGIWVRLLQDRNEALPEAWHLSHTGGLDPSVPGVLEYIAGVVRKIGSWGYGLLKHDFSTYDLMGRWGCEMEWRMTEDGWRFTDDTRTSAEIIRGLYETILCAAKDTGMLVLGCNTVGHLGAGLMHMHRTGDDTSGLMWERTLRFGVNTLAFRAPQHRAFFDIDADCIGISPKIDWKYNRLWGKLLAKSGTSLFYSLKPETLPEEEEEELRAMLRENAKPRAVAQPLDWKDTALPQTWLLEGEETSFSWYEPWGLRVGCASGSVWEMVWKEVSRDL